VIAEPAASVNAEPLDPETFDALIAPLVIPGSAPIGVAVSGGADSLALTLLLADWAVLRGRPVHAFTVDHGLRPEAADEAGWVAEVCAARFIPHTILRPDPPPAPHADQAAARAVRYDALTAACRDAGIGELALAHHRDDQAETLLLRARADSGPAGLAGMPAARERGGVRLLRPLLPVARAHLEATVAAHGLDWVRDPSNADRRYARTRVREAMPLLARQGLDGETLAGIAQSLGRARHVVERARNALLARAVRLDPAGFATIDREAWGDPPPALARAALSQLLCAVGGRTQAPRAQRLDRLARALHAGETRGRTLGGCRIVPRRGDWVVLREVGRTPATPLAPGRETRVDGRFTVRLADTAPAGLTAAPLGDAGWAGLTAADPALRATPVPSPARPALLAIRDRYGPRHVPDLHWTRADADAHELAAWRHTPPVDLLERAFTVAPRPGDIMWQRTGRAHPAATGRRHG